MTSMETREKHVFGRFYDLKVEVDQRYRNMIVNMIKEKNSNDSTKTANIIEDIVSNCGVLFKL